METEPKQKPVTETPEDPTDDSIWTPQPGEWAYDPAKDHIAPWQPPQNSGETTPVLTEFTPELHRLKLREKVSYFIGQLLSDESSTLIQISGSKSADEAINDKSVLKGSLLQGVTANRLKGSLLDNSAEGVSQDLAWGPAYVDPAEAAKAETSEESVLPTYETPIPLAEAVHSFAERRVVKQAPHVRDIAQDATRTNTIQRIKNRAPSVGRTPFREELIAETEWQAAADYQTFLTTFIDVATATHDADYRATIDRAKDMLENTTLIGERERQEAARVIGQYWLAYVKEDDERQVWIVSPERSEGKVKSGEFLLEEVLSQFDEQEIELLTGRLVTDFADVTAKPEDTKVVLMDDWAISGAQMRSAYQDTIEANVRRKEYAPSVEINLVTSPAGRIEKGLSLDFSTTIPIHAYYRSHAASLRGVHGDHESYESGSHSSVDYDFETEHIADIMGKSRDLSAEQAKGSEKLHTVMPGMTNIVRTYRSAELTHLRSFEQQTGQRRLEPSVGLY